MKIEFIFPMRQLPIWVIVTLAVLALIAVGLLYYERRRQARLEQFVGAALVARLLVGYDTTVRRPLVWLPLLGCAGLAATFAQPHWGQAWEEVRKQSRDILVCLDTSESMRAANPLPNRLDRARQKVVSLLERMPGDRFGLVAFSGAAELQCPLTIDHGYFKAVLAATDTDTISLEGTDIAAALEAAVEAFREDDAKSGASSRANRAILLISDGEQVSGDAVEKSEEVARHARIFVMGVGDPEGAEITLPDWMGRYVTVMDGDKPHLSRLDEDSLIKIAQQGDGPYVRSTIDTWDINQIYDRFLTLATRSAASDVRLRLVNRFQWPLAVAISCFMAEGVWLVVLPWMRARKARRPTTAQEEQEYA
ncbi:MAG: VWA domain-containing protein [Candidatus Hydrogenedentes bacterium]|nr:VWA domain-containing protein [Candidatus Hydrogenedentota bacterium]